MYTLDVAKAATNVSVYLEIIDSADGTPETGVVFNTAGIDLQYRRDGAASTAITEVTLANLTTSHTDGGFLHIGNGIYRFDVPDAAFATGVDKVLIHGTVTGMIVIPVAVQLVNEIDLGTDNRVLVSADVHTSGETVANITSKTGYSISGTITTLDGLNNFDPAADTVANVTLVGTTTTNTDMRGTDSALLASSYTAPDNSSISLILADTADLQSNQGNWLTATGFATSTALATVDANVDAILVDTSTTLDTKLNDIQGATFSTTTDSLEAIRDRGDAAWLTGAGGSSPTVTQIVDGVWNELQSAHTTAGTFGKFLDVEVSSVSGGGGLTSQNVRDAMKLAPTAGAPAVGSVDLALDNIEADTNELQTDWVNGGRLDLLLDAIPTTPMRGTDNALLASSYVAPDNSSISLLLADTNELQSNQGNWLTATGFNTVVPDAAGTAPTTAEIVSAIMAGGDIDGYTLEEANKLILASAVGILSGAATNTITIQAADGSKARLTATVDVDGNRSSVIKDATG